MNLKKTKIFTAKVDLKLKEKLKKDLENQGFSFSKPPYSIFSARKNKIVCTLFESGSLVIQGKDMDEFIEFYIEPEILQSFEYTNPESYIDMVPRIGVDEAGKGDFFGPLCVVALFADEVCIKKLIHLNIKDSKTISDKKILKLSKEIKKDCKFSKVILFPKKYNELYEKFLNLNHLLAWSHQAAIFDLLENKHIRNECKKIVVDQFAKKSLIEEYFKKKKESIKLKQEPKAERDIVVAAASILARAFFLEGLEKLEKEINYKLMKGASKKVIEIGAKIVEKFGKDELKNISKEHFKTFKDVLDKLE